MTSSKLLTLGSAIAVIAVSNFAFAKENSALSEMHQKISEDFPAVKHITTEAFAASEKENLILFDVREADEYNVSHISGAIQISPSLSLPDFTKAYRQQTEGKTVIFYCSVGLRSSIFANKSHKALTEIGSGPIYNLEGGIFKWHNEHKPLVEPDRNPTSYIHPYNYFWGRLVNRKSEKRYRNLD